MSQPVFSLFVYVLLKLRRLAQPVGGAGVLRPVRGGIAPGGAGALARRFNGGGRFHAPRAGAPGGSRSQIPGGGCGGRGTGLPSGGVAAAGRLGFGSHSPPGVAPLRLRNRSGAPIGLRPGAANRVAGGGNVAPLPVPPQPGSAPESDRSAFSSGGFVSAGGGAGGRCADHRGHVAVRAPGGRRPDGGGGYPDPRPPASGRARFSPLVGWIGSSNRRDGVALRRGAA